MSSLLYISRSADIFQDAKQRAQLATSAAAYNKQHGVTGILIYTNGFFMQLLEGSQSVLADIFTQIQEDKRYNQVELLGLDDDAQHLFPNWSMNLIEFKETVRETEERFKSVRKAFANNPSLPCVDAYEAFFSPL